MLFFLIHYLLFARPNHTVWKAEPRKREGKSCMAADPPPPPPPSRHHSPHARGFALTVLASATAKTLTSREQYRQLERLEQAILPFSAVSYQLADLCKAPNQERIKRSLHVPYKPYESTFARIFLFLECRGVLAFARTV